LEIACKVAPFFIISQKLTQKFGIFRYYSYICTRYNNVTFMTTQEISQIIADYFKTQPVLKAWLFGSFSRGEQTDSSDVDILFVPDHSGKPFTLFTHAGMYLDLKELLGREVDLVVEGTLRPYAAEKANQDKKLIYEREVA
jgi:predicted nucleotidyltransferase